MSREELRGAPANADEKRASRTCSRALERRGRGQARSRQGAPRAPRGAPVTTSSARRRSVEADFRGAGAAPPSPEEALTRAGVGATKSTSCSSSSSRARSSCAVKESLFFHAEALEAIEDKLVTCSASERRSAGDVKDLLGISRKYAIPLLEYFDGRRRQAVRRAPGLAWGLGAR
jgi:selenocysteine-specific elongation factor